jgi:alpha-methylacyl-CoA racemase
LDATLLRPPGLSLPVTGPLQGVRVIELAGIGPAPYACMLLAEAGADVVRIDRPVAAPSPPGPHWDLLARSRPSVSIDLKHPDGVALVLDLVERADVLVEGFRPGVAERLGVGPAPCQERNPRLIYGRMTGWGQDGPLAERAGHDIDYLAIAGSLWPIGRKGERPLPPMNLLGDFGGGGMLLAFGITAALVEAGRSGTGQVVDAAMIDGTASMLTFLFSLHLAGRWKEERGVNTFDSGAPFYQVYETADGGHFAVGAVEPKFYESLVGALGLAGEDLPDQMDETHWPAMQKRFAAIFETRSRAEWTAIFEGVDACAEPVLSPFEAHGHAHNRHRKTYVEIGGVVQPGPVPRFSRTPTATAGVLPSAPGADTDTALGAWGVPGSRIAALRESGVFGDRGAVTD